MGVPYGTPSSAISAGSVTLQTGTLKKTLLDLFYPIGSFYWSSQSTSPATLFGGTWTQITDTFVYAANAFNATKQGSLTHTHNAGSYHAHIMTDNPYNFYMQQRDLTADEERWPINKLYACGTQESSGMVAHKSIIVSGISSSSSNMPPYITAFCWYRTA